MKFLADMGVSTRTVEWFRREGHDAVHLRELRKQRLPDQAILEYALSESRVVLTMDLDFGYLVAVSHARLPSVITFRLKDETSSNVNWHLNRVLKESSSALLAGAVITVEDHGYRIRLLPITFRGQR